MALQLPMSAVARERSNSGSATTTTTTTISRTTGSAVNLMSSAPAYCGNAATRKPSTGGNQRNLKERERAPNAATATDQPKQQQQQQQQKQQQQQQQQQTRLANASQLFDLDFVHDEQCPLSFTAMRHQEPIEQWLYDRHTWRIRERMKTASVALVLCLNIGVDPPDVVKIQPCSRLECWIDPSSVSAPKAMELIGSNLQMQYERWQPRARYKKCHDPTVEDVKKLCTSLRRNAKGERILFHYNGHGVPKPTANGEIWVFNKTFTQYIPLSIFELINWMAAPSIYVYDCSNAGIIINSFQPFADQHERELEKALVAQAAGAQPPAQLVSYKNCIHLAACAANEILPMNAQLPADLFTSCLTTPINIALKWYAMQEKLGMVPRIQSELIDKIPGKVNDRRTMMGELNWIFTAITDTIAWNTLPRDLFQRLFRQDLLVASLFRNFLLAERILRSHDCTPVSLPALPPCHRHAMWKAWDLVVDLALQQLPDILEQQAAYRQLPFFEHQLTAFQVWLDSESESRTPPEQLPIVLQVLLSQVHRLRALELLARFLDLGPWAVNLALGVGIFPYVLKLLQSSTRELRPVLVFIWAKILAVDPSCQVDLVKEYKYFLTVLQDNIVSKQHRTLSAFVLASIVHNFLLGQTSALQGPLLSICLEQLNDSSWLLRQWLAICLGMLWQNFEKARWSGARDLAHEKLYVLLRDPIPEVRAAAVFALGTFISSVTDRSEEQANNIDRIIAITLLETVGEDMSPLVRLELAAALQWMVLLFESQFVTVYMAEQMNSHSSALVSCGGERSASITHGLPSYVLSTHSLERHGHASIRRGVSSSSISNMSSSSLAGSGGGSAGAGVGNSGGSSNTSSATNAIPFQYIFTKLWQGIYNLGQDPFPLVAITAQKIIAHVRDAALCMITAKEATNATAAATTSGRDQEKLNSSILSVSLPPSPNTRCNYLGASGESPPVGAGAGAAAGAGGTGAGASHWAQKLRLSGSGEAQQRKLRTSSMNDETDGGAGGATASKTVTGTSANVLGLMAGASVPADGNNSARSSGSETNHYTDASNAKAQVLQPIVQTQFIPWAISYFTRPGKQRYSSAEGSTEEEQGQQRWPIDRNSAELRTREYRYQRNELIRRQARREQQENRVQRLDAFSFVRKTQFTPSLVKLLPYEQQIAVAYKEKVLIYDFVRNSVHSYVTEALPDTASGQSLGSSSAGSVSGSNSASRRLNASRLPASRFARVCSFELLNAQDVGLMLVAHDDGVIRVWQSSGGPQDLTSSSSGGEPQAITTRLISAWDALPRAAYYSSTGSAGGGSSSSSSGCITNNSSYLQRLLKSDPLLLNTSGGSAVNSGSTVAAAAAAAATAAAERFAAAALTGGGGGGGGGGVGAGSNSLGSSGGIHYRGSTDIVTAWQQYSQHLVVGCDYYRYLRIWDVERELRLSDLQLGRRETSVRVLSPFVANKRCDLIVAGCADGSVRLFDKRCAPQDARIRVYREHMAPILHACLRANETSLVTGCTAGKLSVLDLRACRAGGATGVLHQWEAGVDITAMASHQVADAVACGNASKICIYSLNGRTQSVLRSNEGFMGSKIGHPTCLSFHPYKVQLAVGFVDNTVAVYSPTPVL
ncbi:regulatory-associated protein of mTOR [Drosophila novamexicana]|uniref:regulatory-associated protein of mTOR n=1 Tax=Drosophila novamexicana TaxID=47314 RepID=UPI0011E5C515|nr:regulatory-associated protein of mTOR [Drosophila novamexicana]